MVKLVRDGTNWRVECTEKERGEMDSFDQEVAKLLKEEGFDGVTDLVDFALKLLYVRGDLKFPRDGSFLHASDLAFGSGTYGLVAMMNGARIGQWAPRTRKEVEAAFWKLREEHAAKREAARAKRAEARAASK